MNTPNAFKILFIAATFAAPEGVAERIQVCREFLRSECFPKLRGVVLGSHLAAKSSLEDALDASGKAGIFIGNRLELIHR